MWSAAESRKKVAVQVTFDFGVDNLNIGDGARQLWNIRGGGSPRWAGNAFDTQ